MLELGIVQWSCPRVQLIDRARELAAHYADIPRAALAEIKKCLASADDRSRDGYEDEITGTRRLYNNLETRRRVAGFLNKSSA
jgi:enoyl-CoA hydratase